MIVVLKDLRMYFLEVVNMYVAKIAHDKGLLFDIRISNYLFILYKELKSKVKKVGISLDNYNKESVDKFFGNTLS